MNLPAVRFVFLRDAAALYGAEGLAYATPGSVGLDLRACFEPAGGATTPPDELLVPAGERVRVPTGVAIEPLAPGRVGFIFSRSGLGAVRGLTVAQGVGVIDPDYRGELTVFLLNTAGAPLSLRRGERVAQLVFLPALQVHLERAGTLSDTTRGTGGFGHTGAL